MATDPYFTDHHHPANYYETTNNNNPDDVHDNGMQRLEDSAALYAASQPEPQANVDNGYPPHEGTDHAYQYATAAAPVSNPNLNNESVVGGGDSSTVPDIMVLNVLCAQAKAPKDVNHEESVAEAEESWQAVREWLSSNNAETVRAAAEQRGESGLTALHFACRNVPPLDVINVFLSIAADTVQWPDSFGWLPVHYACASGSDTAVIQALTESFPESKTTTDRRQRTPLHFALGEKPASPDVIFLLSSTGAASYPDEIGMLVRTP